MKKSILVLATLALLFWPNSKAQEPTEPPSSPPPEPGEQPVMDESGPQVKPINPDLMEFE